MINEPGSMEAAADWRLASEPMVDIGSGVDTESPLHRVISIDPMTDARVAILTEGSGMIFGRDGSRLATLGAPGDGPGELSPDPSSILQISEDSVAIWDGGRRRLTIFTTDGVVGREVSLADQTPRTPMMSGNVLERASFSTLLESGPRHWILFRVAAFGEHPEGPSRISDTSERLSHDAEITTTYGPFPGFELFNGGSTGIAPYPFNRTTHGTTVGESLVVGLGETTSYRVFDSGGALARIVRWPDTRGPFGGPLVETFERWMGEQLSERDPREAEMLQGILDAMPPPERLPPYDGIISSDRGEIWVGDYAGQMGLMMFSDEVPRMPERGFLVFDSEGVIVATVRTPVGFVPHTVEDGLVWGVYRDELHVESVRAYPLDR